jgi:hypothetical protein
LSVIIASETAVRNIPNTVNVEQAKALVDKGEAIWIDPLPEVSSKQASQSLEPADGPGSTPMFETILTMCPEE